MKKGNAFIWSTALIAAISAGSIAFGLGISTGPRTTEAVAAKTVKSASELAPAPNKEKTGEVKETSELLDVVNLQHCEKIAITPEGPPMGWLLTIDTGGSEGDGHIVAEDANGSAISELIPMGGGEITVPVSPTGQVFLHYIAEDESKPQSASPTYTLNPSPPH